MTSAPLRYAPTASQVRARKSGSRLVMMEGDLRADDVPVFVVSAVRGSHVAATWQ